MQHAEATKESAPETDALAAIAGRRIALFLPDLRGGGAERVMLNIARALSERGVRVDIVLAERQGEYLDHVPASIRIVDLHSKRILQSTGPLAKYLRDEKPDALISALSHVNAIALVARQMARTNTRVIISLHNTMSVEAASETGWKQKIVPAVTRALASKADAVVAVSGGVADDYAHLIGIPRDRIDVIYNPVISPEMLAKSGEPVDHPWFAPGEPPVILGVGRLNPQKDFATLLKAFAKVRKQRPARLLILGQGEERAALESLAEELALGADVSLPGFAKNPFAYMSKAAVFALSSRFEGLPTVLIEALACGCPVVATDCPSGPSEILKGVPSGRLAPVGDPGKFAEALLDVLNDPGPIPPQETWSRYTLPFAAARYAGVIERVLLSHVPGSK
jgi:glycosyltransferase involved in cell wall biosynthesis